MKNKILIIDDCLPILNSLRIILELHHYDVEITQDGAHLFEQHDALPDLILTDYHMPSIDYASMIKQLKTDARFKHIPVILMSGNLEIERISIILGVNDFVAKPFDFGDLLNKIKVCIDA